MPGSTIDSSSLWISYRHFSAAKFVHNVHIHVKKWKATKPQRHDVLEIAGYAIYNMRGKHYMQHDTATCITYYRA